MAPDGGGIIDLKALIGKARKGGVDHFYVEYDRSADPMKEIRTSFDYLCKIG